MTKKFDTLIPFNAGTLIKEEKIKNWIDKDYQKLTSIFERIKNRQEFGIQIFYNTKIEKQKLKGKVKDYVDKQKKLRKELMSKLTKYKEDFYNQIVKIVDETKNVESSTSLVDKQNLLNLICLVDKNKIEKLKNYLKKINNMKGFSVNFNGPWAPYSFVN
ncbi:MAG: GvpL/GvpF family gas vesicle protein, partial [Nanoarchaeota archaeon]|nr:GvpL/GvpF family gas vesicle protein [Nanoarchaeota archaeon]